jgi:hypothetical protein
LPLDLLLVAADLARRLFTCRSPSPADQHRISRKPLPTAARPPSVRKPQAMRPVKRRVQTLRSQRTETGAPIGPACLHRGERGRLRPMGG